MLALKFANIIDDMKTTDIKKGGRKRLPQEVKKIYKVSTKLSEEEYRSLMAKVAEFKGTKSSLIRQCIANTAVSSRITKEELDVLKELTMNIRNYGRNLRDVAIRANSWSGSNKVFEEDMRCAMLFLEEVKNKYHKILMR